jgi:protein-tyrosine phosphatase
VIIGGDIEAHRVAPKLYVGSSPPAVLKYRGFDVSVLCALEDQSPRGILTLHVPLVDIEELHPGEIHEAAAVAQVVHNFRQDGSRVLVTCAAGVNLSAFVAALTLVCGGWTPAGAIERIRERRVPPVGMRPLSNRRFVRAIHEFATQASLGVCRRRGSA